MSCFQIQDSSSFYSIVLVLVTVLVFRTLDGQEPYHSFRSTQDTTLAHRNSLRCCVMMLCHPVSDSTLYTRNRAGRAAR